jgi:glutamate formiminotransferase
MITPAIDTKIHNIMYATSVGGRMLMVAFNTTTDYSKTWLPTGKAIMSSLRVKPQ